MIVVNYTRKEVLIWRNATLVMDQGNVGFVRVRVITAENSAETVGVLESVLLVMALGKNNRLHL